MKIYKVVLTIIDFDGIGEDGIIGAIEHTKYPNRCISPHVQSIEDRDIGEWYDEHPLNYRDKAKAEIDRLFGNN